MKSNKKITYIAVAVALLVVFFLLFGFSLPMFAQETSVTSSGALSANQINASGQLKVRTQTNTTDDDKGENSRIQMEAHEETNARVGMPEDAEAPQQEREASREDGVATTTVRAKLLQRFQETRLRLSNEIETRRDDFKKQLRNENDEINIRIQARRQMIASTTSEIQVRLSEKARVAVKNQVDTITHRFDTILGNLTTLSSNIASRISKLQEAGADVSESIDLLAKADAQLEISKTDIAAAETKVRAEVANTGEVSNLDIRATIQVAADSLKTTHAAYVDAVESLKRVSVNNTATLNMLDEETTSTQ